MPLTGLEVSLISGGAALIGSTVTAIIAMIRGNGKSSSFNSEDRFDDVIAGQSNIMLALTNHVSDLSKSISNMVTEQKVTNTLLKERLPRRGDN